MIDDQSLPLNPATNEATAEDTNTTVMMPEQNQKDFDASALSCAEKGIRCDENKNAARTTTNKQSLCFVPIDSVALAPNRQDSTRQDEAELLREMTEKIQIEVLKRDLGGEETEEEESATRGCEEQTQKERVLAASRPEQNGVTAYASHQSKLKNTQTNEKEAMAHRKAHLQVEDGETDRFNAHCQGSYVANQLENSKGNVVGPIKKKLDPDNEQTIQKDPVCQGGIYCNNTHQEEHAAYDFAVLQGSQEADCPDCNQKPSPQQLASEGTGSADVSHGSDLEDWINRPDKQEKKACSSKEEGDDCTTAASSHQEAFCSSRNVMLKKTEPQPEPSGANNDRTVQDQEHQDSLDTEEAYSERQRVVHEKRWQTDSIALHRHRGSASAPSSCTGKVQNSVAYSRKNRVDQQENNNDRSSTEALRQQAAPSLTSPHNTYITVNEDEETDMEEDHLEHEPESGQRHQQQSLPLTTTLPHPYLDTPLEDDDDTEPTLVLQGVLFDPEVEDRELRERANQAADEILNNVATTAAAQQGGSYPEATVLGIAPPRQSGKEARARERTERRKRIWIGLGSLFVCLVVGTLIGSFLARSMVTPLASLRGVNETPAVISPTSGPTFQTPTAPPLVPIESAEELYRAVDAYLEEGRGSSNTTSVAGKYGHPIGSWDVSRVASFEEVFSSERNGLSESFDEDLSAWDVSGATTMAQMFLEASTFNQDLSPWNVSKVGDFHGMFEAATAFNQDLSKWDISSATDTSAMFAYASAFDGDLSRWNTSNIRSMYTMFFHASSFTGKSLSAWDTSSVEFMDTMFAGALTFDADLSGWNVSNVVNMDGLFQEALNFGQLYPNTLSAWDTSRVTSMKHMFYRAYSFNGNVSLWNVGQIQDMSLLFYEALSFDGDLSLWDVSAATSMLAMFTSAVSFNQNLSLWNVSRVETTELMFYAALTYNGDVADWDMSSNKNMEEMFRSCEAFNGNLSSWNVSQVESMAGFLEGASAFNGDLSDWDVSSVTSMNWMFANTTSFNGTDLSSWDVSKVRAMDWMFADSNFNGDISKWNVSQVTNATSMFQSAVRFNQNLCAWGDLLTPPSASKSSETVRFLQPDVSDMFNGSGCPATGDPVLETSPVGPLCHSCRNSSES